MPVGNTVYQKQTATCTHTAKMNSQKNINVPVENENEENKCTGENDKIMENLQLYKILKYKHRNTYLAYNCQDLNNLTNCN